MQDIDLISPTFRSGSSIPDRFTCAGEGVSPPLEWRKIPQETKSLSLIVDDPDAPGGMFVHWLLYNLPPDMQGLPENYSPSQEVGVGRNGFGQAGYGGPCPPEGEKHHYYFRLYALDKTLDLANGATRGQVTNAMQGHILAETELIGLFGS